MFPRQGEWTESAYLNHEFEGLVEFVDGMLEFLPTPTLPHQDLVAFLFERLNAFVGPRIPREVYFAPLRIRMNDGNIREPDVVYIRAERVQDRNAPPSGADLVMEVVSGGPSDRQRDYHVKRREYALTGIREYWIVDPETKVITVFVLEGSEYRIHGEFPQGTAASSVLLTGFEMDVTEAFGSVETWDFGDSTNPSETGRFS